MKGVLVSVARGVAISALLCATSAVRADEVKEVKKETKVRTVDKDPGAGMDKAADNTGKNKRDRKEGEPTADQQKNNRSDLETTRLIRRSLMKDKSLSISAHNVKIIAQKGAEILDRWK